MNRGPYKISAIKISAMCGALAIGSLGLCAATLARLEEMVPVFFDDRLFGYRWPYVAEYYAIDALCMGGVAIFIRRRPAIAAAVGAAWTGFLLAEALVDAGQFAGDPHLLFEELSLAVIYAVLLMLLVATSLSASRSRRPVPAG